MSDSPTRHDGTEQPVSGDGPEGSHVAIPPVEDLFDVTTNPTDFMSAQSFPASDPPSYVA